MKLASIFMVGLMAFGVANADERVDGSSQKKVESAQVQVIVMNGANNEVKVYEIAASLVPADVRDGSFQKLGAKERAEKMETRAAALVALEDAGKATSKTIEVSDADARTNSSEASLWIGHGGHYAHHYRGWNHWNGFRHRVGHAVNYAYNRIRRWNNWGYRGHHHHYDSFAWRAPVYNHYRAWGGNYGFDYIYCS